MRRDVAEKAVRLFTAQGFANTSVEEIADAADVSKSTFFRLFPRKEDAVFFDLPERLEAMRAEFTASNHPKVWTTVRRVFIENARMWEDEDQSFGLARAMLFHSEPALEARYLEVCREWEDAVADFVADERGVDPRTDLNSRLIATAVVSAFRAAFLVSVHGSGKNNGIAENLERAFDALEAGLPTG